MKMNCFKLIQMSLKIQHCQGMNIYTFKNFKNFSLNFHKLVNLPLIDSLEKYEKYMKLFILQNEHGELSEMWF